MANPEHVAILKQGVEAWNRWRNDNPCLIPDLVGDIVNGQRTVKFEGLDLRGVNFFRAMLTGASFSQSDLSHSFFGMAVLRNVTFIATNLSGSFFQWADLTNACLAYANLEGAWFGSTTFAGTDLSLATLTGIRHHGPSSIGIDTVICNIKHPPLDFFEAAGVPRGVLETLVGAIERPKPDYPTVFISYASNDQSFADSIHGHLRLARIDSWYAPTDLRIGDHFRSQIDQSIRRQDKVLLILSSASVKSQWVRDEVEAALERERRENRLLLFPIRIDDAVAETEQAWAASIRRTRHIGDFTKWKDPTSYHQAFERLLRDLKSEQATEAEAYLVRLGWVGHNLHLVWPKRIAAWDGMPELRKQVGDGVHY